MEDLSTLGVFAAGLLSFLSPCVLPLIPAYLSFISGVSVTEMRTEASERRALGRVFLNALLFVAGFSFVFVLLGASATFAGKFLTSQMAVFKKVAGVLVILFGFHTLGVFRLGFLERERRYHQRTKPFGLIGSFVVGMAFAFGWTPCIGPILATVLFYAGTQDTVGRGVWLLSTYSAGLGIPFLVAALGLERFLSVSDSVKRHFRALEIVSGLLLMGVGVLILTDDLTRVAMYFVQLFGDSAVPH